MFVKKEMCKAQIKYFSELDSDLELKEQITKTLQKVKHSMSLLHDSTRLRLIAHFCTYIDSN